MSQSSLFNDNVSRLLAESLDSLSFPFDARIFHSSHDTDRNEKFDQLDRWKGKTQVGAVQESGCMGWDGMHTHLSVWDGTGQDRERCAVEKWTPHYLSCMQEKSSWKVRVIQQSKIKQKMGGRKVANIPGIKKVKRMEKKRRRSEMVENK